MVTKKIDFSYRTIIFIVLFLLGLWLAFLIKDIILQVFVALLIVIILNPLVVKLSKFKIPKTVSVFLVYILVIGLLGFIVARIVPILVDQTTSFANSVPAYLSELNVPLLVTDSVAAELTNQISQVPSQVVRVGLSVFSNVINVIVVLVFAFYLLLERERIDEQFASLFGPKQSKRLADVIDKLEKKLGGWARGQLILMFVVGLANYIGLLVLGIPFALSLALLAGILEIVPIIGPILAAVPAAVVGFGVSPVAGFAVIALAFLIQQFENYVLVPKIMQKSVGMSPIVTLFSLTVGFRLAGILGALLSIPVVITLQILAKEYMFSKR